MNKIYCTYFDRNYLLQGIAMIDSLRKFDSGSKIVILALDDESQEYLLKYNIPNCLLVNLADIENKFPILLDSKKNRSKVEYYFTITPALIKYVIDLDSKVETLAIYLDADLFFFGNPEEVFVEMIFFSVAIIPHRFNLKLEKKMNRFGIYNVGMVIFKSDLEGKKVLDWWLQSCIEWCYDYVDNGKFADQGYLNNFEQISKKVLVIDHLGANLAPWNVSNYEIRERSSNLYVNDYQLIFFHFHNVKIFFNKFLIPNIYYGSKLTKIVKKNIYRIYLIKILEFSNKINIPLDNFKLIFNRKQNFLKKIIKFLLIILIFIRGDYINLKNKEFRQYVKP